MLDMNQGSGYKDNTNDSEKTDLFPIFKPPTSLMLSAQKWFVVNALVSAPQKTTAVSGN